MQLVRLFLLNLWTLYTSSVIAYGGGVFFFFFPPPFLGVTPFLLFFTAITESEMGG